MYKNFNITESEKEQIINRLKENGYGQPITKNIISERINLENNYDVVLYNEKEPLFKLLRSKSTKKYGVFNQSTNKWAFKHGGGEFKETGSDLLGEKSKKIELITQYTNKNGDKFYTLINVYTHNGRIVVPGGYLFEKLNSKFYEKNKKESEPIQDTSDDDRVYEENPLNEGKQILIDTFKKLIK